MAHGINTILLVVSFETCPAGQNYTEKIVSFVYLTGG